MVPALASPSGRVPPPSGRSLAGSSYVGPPVAWARLKVESIAPIGTMKKHPAGFVPVDFQRAGKVVLALGAICLILSGLDSLVGADFITDKIVYFGLGFLVLSAYLIFVVPKEKE